MVRFSIALTALLVLCVAATAAVPDWPNWRGPTHDGKSAETGLLAEWPDDGPPLLWKMSGLGKGFSSVAIVGNRLYTMGDRNEKQYILAVDLETRKELWAAEVGKPWGDGTRCTPTVDDGLVYGLGTHGDLVCVQAADGREVWRKNFEKDFGGRMMSSWGYSESPQTDGDKLICTPGAKDAIVAALNKKTGETVWKCAMPDIGGKGKDGAGYASICVTEAAGVRQYVTIVGRGAIGVRASDGKFLWGYNRVANGTADIPDAIPSGDRVFVSTGYGDGGAALLKLSADGQGVKAEEVYFLEPKTFQNHHGGMILLGDYIYAGHGRGRGKPVCIELKTGRIVWQADRQPGSGSAAVTWADGHVYFRNENAQMALVEATPEAYRLKGRFKIAVKNGQSWAHPVIHDGKLYLRDHDDLVCYDLRKK